MNQTVTMVISGGHLKKFLMGEISWDSSVITLPVLLPSVRNQNQTSYFLCVQIYSELNISRIQYFNQSLVYTQADKSI